MSLTTMNTMMTEDTVPGKKRHRCNTSSMETPHLCRIITRSVRVAQVDAIMKRMPIINCNFSKPLWVWTKCEVLELFEQSPSKNSIKEKWKVKPLLNGQWLQHIAEGSIFHFKLLFKTPGEDQSFRAMDKNDFLESLEVVQFISSEARFLFLHIY